MSKYHEFYLFNKKFHSICEGKVRIETNHLKRASVYQVEKMGST